LESRRQRAENRRREPEEDTRDRLSERSRERGEKLVTGKRRDGEEIDRAGGSRPAFKHIDEEETAIEEGVI